MTWLSRLKKISTHAETDATKATKPINDDETGGFVGFVAPILAPMQKITGDRAAANDPAPDPDRWCWPHSTAMNTAELDLFAARLERFTDKGVIQIEAEGLADKLAYRDRDSDDRRLCLECTHLAGYGQSSWRCANWQAAGVAIKARDAKLPVELTRKLQRCGGFGLISLPASRLGIRQLA
jgi:hypothetical protein